jgi:hypothetical protein
VLRSVTLALLLSAASLPAAGQQRQTNRDFRWDGSVPEGRWLYVRNLNGGIRVERGSGNRVEVTAEKSWRRGNPEDVRIEVRQVGSGRQDVIICALWEGISECDETGYRTRDSRDRDRRRERDNDVAVEFTVRLPAGVKLEVSSINGSLEIDGASTQVEAHTVNGGITARSTGGPVNATTVNGSIEARMGATGSENLRFETVNGSIAVWVPENIDAEVDMRTVTGRVSSDFPLTVSGRINPRQIRATIGRGGRRIELRTVHGSVDLRKP